MHDLLNPTALVKDFGYLGVFITLFLESGIVFGFFLPGDSLLFTAGLLASQHYLNLAVLIIVSIIAAILGNNAGYLTGKTLGKSLFSKKGSFWFSPRRIEEAHLFFEKRGSSSLILARFIPAIRTFVPIIAGVGKMSYPKFLTFNAVGGALWGISLPILGYYIGKTVPNIDKYILPVVIVIVFVSALPVLIPWLRHRIVRKLSDKL